MKEKDSASAGGLLLASFFTGAAALAFEVLWSRRLVPWVGGTALAQIGTVAAYMLGLFLGAVWGGAALRKSQDPRRLFLLAEAGAGAWALLSVLGLPVASPLFAQLSRGDLLASGLGSLLRGAAGSIIFLPSTFLMGYGFPALISALEKEGKGRRSTALGYGINTLGAALGAFAGGFFIVPGLGLLAGAGAVALVEALVIYLAWERADIGPGNVTAPTAPEPSSEPSGLVLSVALGGFAALAYEIFLFRILGLILGPTARAFTVVLTAYVLGLGLGSLALGRLLAKKSAQPQAAYVASWILAGLFAAGLHQGLYVLPLGLAPGLTAWGDALPALLARKALLALALLVPLTACFGAAFAAANAVAGPRAAGRLYAWLTFGNLTGLVAGAALLPALGLDRGSAGLLGLAWIVPLPLLIVRPASLRTRILGLLLGGIGLVGGGLLPRWNPERMQGAPYMYLESAPEGRGRFPLFLRDGFESSVSVFKDRDNILFKIDGKVDGSNTAADKPTQALLGLIPALLHPAPEKALVIGLGTGQTAGELLRLPLQTLDCAELSAAIPRAARTFQSINRSFWEDPRFHLLLTDGRSLLRYGGRQYDVIVSEPSNLWCPGVAQLFTREAFEEAKKSLAPGGVFCQWIHGYSLEGEAFQALCRTFLSVFGDSTSLWVSSPEFVDLYLIGGWKGTLDAGALEKRLAELRIPNPILPGLTLDASSFISFYVAGSAGLAKEAGTGFLTSDGKPWLEYSAERGMRQATRSWMHATLARLIEKPSYRIQGGKPGLAKALDRRAEAHAALRRFLAEGRLGSIHNQADYDRFQSDMAALKSLCASNSDYSELRFSAASQIYARGNSAWRDQAVTVAEVMFKEALEVWPEHPDTLGNYATLLQNRKDFSRAHELLEICKRVGSGVLPLAQEGELLMNEGRLGEAADVFRQALVRDPLSVACLGNLGICEFQLGDRTGAVDCFHEILRLDPWNKPAKDNLKKLEQL